MNGEKREEDNPPQHTRRRDCPSPCCLANGVSN